MIAVLYWTSRTSTVSVFLIYVMFGSVNENHGVGGCSKSIAEDKAVDIFIHNLVWTDY